MIRRPPRSTLDRSSAASDVYKRQARDSRTLTLQENRAKAVVAGEKAARTPRFVKTSNGARTLDEASLVRARRLEGLKGYVTNIPVELMPAREVISSYHDLWQVEASFRMSKSDLRARPIFHHTKDAIEAHLSIVFAALAISRRLQDQTGMSIKKVVRCLLYTSDAADDGSSVDLGGRRIIKKKQKKQQKNKKQQT